MARQQPTNRQEQKPEEVDCKMCKFGGKEVVNHLLDCFNKERNPKGYKVGCWLKECRFYQARKA
jgi:hypothetical protein